MSKIALVEVISFSTEHPVNRVSNLLKGLGKWTNPVKNVSAKGKEVTIIQAEFKIPLCKIEAINIGNCWSSTIEIEVGRSGESASSRIPLLKNPTLNLMTRIDCRDGKNAEAMKFLCKDDLNPNVIETQKFKGWDRLAILCKQSDKNDVLFGISTLELRGKVLVKPEVLIDFQDTSTNSFKREVDKSSDFLKKQPDWYIPGSRASKLIEKSLKERDPSIETSSKKEKENRPHFVSPSRKLLRKEDDLTVRSSSSSATSSSSKASRLVCKVMFHFSNIYI